MIAQQQNISELAPLLKTRYGGSMKRRKKPRQNRRVKRGGVKGMITRDGHRRTAVDTGRYSGR